MRTWAGVAIASLLLACGSDKPRPPALEMQPGLFEMQTEGKGLLRAATSTPVSVPNELRGRQNLAWLMADGATVKTGDIVARLDQTEAERQEQESRNSVSKVDLQINARSGSQGQERFELGEQLRMTGLERDVTQRFSQKDESVFSRNDIIDAQVSLEFLDKKSGILQSKQKRQGKQHAADMQLLGLQRQTHALRMQQVVDARGRMSLAAPHDGVFVLGRTWSGDRIKVGDTLWTGQEIGQLPDLSTLEALIRVLESEMSGVTVGTPATVELDAQPGVIYTGKVKSVSAVASPIERESPLKYFDVMVAFDKPDTAIMKPGLSAHAVLHVKRQESVLAVPNQALFRKGDENWVWIESGHSYEKRPVKIGDRSPMRSVIAEGLKPGDRVALGDPERAQ